jgi:biopolymer transport protein ExbD
MTIAEKSSSWNEATEKKTWKINVSPDVNISFVFIFFVVIYAQELNRAYPKQNVSPHTSSTGCSSTFEVARK